MSGIGRIDLLMGGRVAPGNLVSATVDVEDIVVTIPRSSYNLRCARLYISVPDSLTVVIRAQGDLMQTGTMNVSMFIPVSSPEFTFRYAGSLSGMGLRALNPFLEVAEHKRFKSGSPESALFEVNLMAGRAITTHTIPGRMSTS